MLKNPNSVLNTQILRRRYVKFRGYFCEFCYSGNCAITKYIPATFAIYEMK